MFAVVKTGGKQYRIAVDDVIEVEKLAGDAGATIEFQDVLMVGNDKGVTVGTPTVSGIAVTGEVVKQTRGDKIIVFKKQRRHHYRRKNGHRQELTVVRITGIGDVKAAPKAEKTAAKAETEGDAKAPAKKAAPKKAAAPRAKAGAKKAKAEE